MKVHKPPASLSAVDLHDFNIFLAGSIENGSAEDWQKKLESELEGQDCALLNPRRDHWDPLWSQTTDSPQLKAQAKWELDALDLADLIVMYFDPATKSPITLLELGLYADSGKLIVCCPDGFWRKGNVEIVCERYNVRLLNSWDRFVEEIKFHIP